MSSQEITTYDTWKFEVLPREFISDVVIGNHGKRDLPIRDMIAAIWQRKRQTNSKVLFIWFKNYILLYSPIGEPHKRTIAHIQV